MAAHSHERTNHSVIVDGIRIEPAELPGPLRSWFQVLDGEQVLFLRPDIYAERILRPLAQPLAAFVASCEMVPAPRGAMR